MHTKLLHEHDGRRTFGRRPRGRREGHGGARALRRGREDHGGADHRNRRVQNRGTRLDREKKDYQPLKVDEQVEVASMIGDAALAPIREPALHIHLALGRRDDPAAAPIPEGRARGSSVLVFIHLDTYKPTAVSQRTLAPEDCGGPPGYEAFLEAISDPSHPEHADALEWYGEPYDAEDIEPEAIKAQLSRIARSRRGGLKARGRPRKLH